MTFTPFKKLITKISLGDNLQRNQSTFTNEIKEMKAMIESTDQHSIILADELCSGTEIDSALSLVASTLISLNNKKCRFMFTTHYHDLLDIPEIMELDALKICHMKVTIDNNKIIFDRSLQPGKCNNYYGIEIAQYMKMPVEFISQAIKIRNRLTNNREIISTKKSRYNTSIYMNECYICKDSKNRLETHHIIFQSQLKGEGKNYKNNLLVICENCHDNIHNGKLHIEKISETNEGRDIQFIKS
jgi:DNA mismatch repair protein MutS